MYRSTLTRVSSTLLISFLSGVGKLGIPLVSYARAFGSNQDTATIRGLLLRSGAGKRRHNSFPANEDTRARKVVLRVFPNKEALLVGSLDHPGAILGSASGPCSPTG